MSIKNTALIFFTTRVTAIVATGLLSTTLAVAQEAAPAPAPVLVKPTPLLQEGRFVPGFGNEGIITARYTVKADGTTGDVEVLDGGFTNPFYENIIKQNVGKWTFAPGTVNGEARDFFNQEFTFRMRVSETLGVSEDVQKELEALNKNISDKNFETAVDATRNTLKKAHSVMDYALLNQMLATAYSGMNDPYAALEASKRATQTAVNIGGTQDYMLTPALLQSALKQRLMLAAAVRQQGEVLRTWEELDALYDVPADDAVMQWVETARQQVAAPDQLSSLGKISENKHQTYVPVHRIFTVADVREGKLDKVVAHCERRTLELEYMEGVDWTLPASFGECKLDFRGDNGTLFSIYEFAQ
ncbi:MAG: hypothetical protein V4603_05185 [Pseudomonadota bacterium]